MNKAPAVKKLLIHLSLFILFNLTLYVLLSRFHNLIPFDMFDYQTGAHHYLPDPRVKHLPFNLLSGLDVYDAQWFVKIAAGGYIYHPHTPISLGSPYAMDNLSYNLYPLFPLLVRSVYFLVPRLELAAFITSQLLMLLAFTSLYIFTTRFFSSSIAVKTVWLVFLFPFSIFFHTYYAESLLLTLSVWFLYFLLQERYLPSALFLSLLDVTKGRAFPLNLLFYFELCRALYRHRIGFRTFFLSSAISVIPLSFWFLFNYLTTGRPLYFMSVVAAWEPYRWWQLIFVNLVTVINFFYLPLHRYHASQIEVLSLFLFTCLIILSRRYLRPRLWWFSLLVLVFPLFIVDLTSFSRFQSVSFPLFIFVAAKLPPKIYPVVVILLIPLFLLSFLFFINWYWVG